MLGERAFGQNVDAKAGADAVKLAIDGIGGPSEPAVRVSSITRLTRTRLAALVTDWLAFSTSTPDRMASNCGLSPRRTLVRTALSTSSTVRQILLCQDQGPLSEKQVVEGDLDVGDQVQPRFRQTGRGTCHAGFCCPLAGRTFRRPSIGCPTVRLNSVTDSRTARIEQSQISHPASATIRADEGLR